MSEQTLKGRFSNGSPFFSLWRWKRQSIWLLFSLLVVFFLFLWPVLRLIFLSFSAEEGFTFANYVTVLQEARTWTILSNTAIIVTG